MQLRRDPLVEWPPITSDFSLSQTLIVGKFCGNYEYLTRGAGAYMQSVSVLKPLRRGVVIAVVAAIALPLVGCMSANQVAMEVGKPPAGAVELRNLQTRRFSTPDQMSLLQAAVQTLQDLGYTVTESSPDVGVLVASKQRDAHEAGQVGLQVALTILAAIGGRVHNPIFDKEQTINVTLVATPIQNSQQIEVRASFDRWIVNNHGQKWKSELLMEPALYQEFFEKFSASAFLEAEKI